MSAYFLKFLQYSLDLSCMCATPWSDWDLGSGLFFNIVLDIIGMLIWTRSTHVQFGSEMRSS